MSIDKKALIAQISQNVKVPASPTSGSDVPKPMEDPKVEKPEKPRRTLRKKGKPEVALTGISSGRQAAFWLDDEDRGIFERSGCFCTHKESNPATTLYCAPRCA